MNWTYRSISDPQSASIEVLNTAPLQFFDVFLWCLPHRRRQNMYDCGPNYVELDFYRTVEYRDAISSLRLTESIVRMETMTDNENQLKSIQLTETSSDRGWLKVIGRGGRLISRIFKTFRTRSVDLRRDLLFFNRSLMESRSVVKNWSPDVIVVLRIARQYCMHSESGNSAVPRRSCHWQKPMQGTSLPMLSLQRASATKELAGLLRPLVVIQASIRNVYKLDVKYNYAIILVHLIVSARPRWMSRLISSSRTCLSTSLIWTDMMRSGRLSGYASISWSAMDSSVKSEETRMN